MTACIQEGNTTAHQKCRQSLSPDTKAHIQEGNTTTHQKHWQSLSQGNTTTHQKHWQSLSPHTKAHMLKIHAEEQQK
jgi:hypothetical protein